MTLGLLLSELQRERTRRKSLAGVFARSRRCRAERFYEAFHLIFRFKVRARNL